MIWNIVVGVIIFVGLVGAVLLAKKQIANPCEGCSGCTPIKLEEKKLEGVIVMKKKFHVKGMTCSNCYNIVESSINQINGLRAKINGKKREVIVKGIREFSEDEINQVLKNHGFSL